MIIAEFFKKSKEIFQTALCGPASRRPYARAVFMRRFALLRSDARTVFMQSFALHRSYARAVFMCGVVSTRRFLAQFFVGLCLVPFGTAYVKFFFSVKKFFQTY